MKLLENVWMKKAVKWHKPVNWIDDKPDTDSDGVPDRKDKAVFNYKRN